MIGGIASNFVPYTSIDPELAKFDNEFVAEVKKYCREDQYFHPIQKRIFFENIEDKQVIAQCGYSPFNFKVGVSYFHWRRSSEEQKFATLNHEFTHCYFKVGHNPDPGNYMYAFENYLPREVVKKQLTDFLAERCFRE